MKRVLLLSISDFSGHRLAADALEQTFAKHPQISVHSFNFFKALPAWMVRSIDGAYYRMIDRKPGYWSFLRNNPILAVLLKPLKALFCLWAAWRFLRKHGQDFDLCICTQTFPCLAMATYRKYFSAPWQVWAVITDFHRNAYWCHPQVHGYILPCAQLKAEMSALGTEDSRLHVLGIPLRPAFALEVDRQNVWQSFAWQEGKPVVLLMGGSLGLGAIEDVLEQLSRQEHWRAIVLCGSNQELYERLNNQYQSFEHLRILGFADNVHELMSISTVLASKPGGVTVAEALSKALPMISLNPIAGQEEGNEQYLLKHGWAFKARSASEVMGILNKHAHDFEAMSQRIADQKCANSSAEVLKKISEEAHLGL